jgi:poly(hydroxyalkanoate) depolymerase family esterase
MSRLRSVILAATCALAASWIPVAAPAGAAVTSSGCGAMTQAPANWPAGDPGKLFQCAYTQDGLARTSVVYQPSTWKSTHAAPVVVVLHGCTEQAGDIAAISRFDREAERGGFIAVFPNQADFTSTGITTFDGNGSHCWNWFLPQGQARDAGEPALVAGLTREAVSLWHGDHARTYVIGISAGGALSDIMAATYPDLFAATGILAGCEYRGLPCLGSASAVPPQVSGQLAYAAAGSHARVVPFIVENGDADPAVPLPNAFEVVQQWQVTDDYAAHHGTLANPVPPGPCAQRTVTPGSPVDTSQSPPAVRNPYDVLYYSAGGAPCTTTPTAAHPDLGELWIVHGEFHAWPGGPPLTTTEIYTNPGGPDFTHIAYQFFMAHPCRVARGVCAAA